MKVTVNGHSTYCYTNRKPISANKESVVFIHGAGLDHTVWTLPARHFARHGRNVIAVDLPGHGRSEGAPLTSIQAMADWIVDVLDALEVDNTALVGHSMGSLVALDCAARHQERLRALALLGSTAPMPVADALLEAAGANEHAAFDTLTTFGYSKRHQYGGNSNPGIWMIGATLRLFERSAPGVLHADLNACNQYDSGVERAASLQCPTLAIVGIEDRLTPLRGARGLLEAIPNADIRKLADSGHTMTSEAPNEVLDALKSII